MRIGILAIQGDVEEHAEILERLFVESKEVKLPEDLKNIDGLIIPGGESTTFRKLLLRSGMFDALLEFDRPIMGTCAGIIVMARKIANEEEPHHTLGKLNIEVERNAYGRQIESFEAEVEYTFDGKARVAFIRAPRIMKLLSDDVEVIAKLNGEIVGVRDGKNIGFTFHPEITGDTTAHEYFLKIVESA